MLIEEEKSDEELFNATQRMFVFDTEFVSALNFLIRIATKNFIEANREASINGLPIELGLLVEKHENV